MALESTEASILESTLDDISSGHPSFRLDLSSPYKDMTMLHIAVGFSENEPSSVEILLMHSICKNKNPNILNWTEERMSPLHLAVVNDYDRVAELLIRYGGDPKVKTGDGKSSFHLCVETMSEELLEKCFSLFCRKYLKFRQSLGGLANLTQQSNVVGVGASRKSRRFSIVSLKKGSPPSSRPKVKYFVNKNFRFWFLYWVA